MTPAEKKRQIETANSFYGFNRHNGIEIVDVDDGTSVIEVPLRKESNNPLGIAHGGLIFSLCDVAAGVAARSGGRNTVSQDASIYFLSPGVNTTKLTAKGHVIREGGRTGIAESEVLTDDGALVAKATVTIHYMD
ncbi:MAG: PaaI family thioesterase [Oscillospiraceae bacterium]|nr:PaaI family thioesterase [Oscillospiraceae bacterium]